MKRWSGGCGRSRLSWRARAGAPRRSGRRIPSGTVPKNAKGEPNLDAPAPRTADGKPDLSGAVARRADGRTRRAGPVAPPGTPPIAMFRDVAQNYQGRSADHAVGARRC